jgi:Vitamin K-dependent gamma-carboxylase
MIWRRWVELWDRREDAAALAFVRIFVGVVLALDYLDLARLGLVDAVYVGFGVPYDGWLSPHTTYVVALAASLALATGTLTRVACIVFVAASVQLSHMSPNAERGIDTILRIVVGILAFSQCHARWSVDAFVRRRLGTPLAHEVPAWPRYLLLLQLVWIYVSGAMNKGGAPWFPHGGFTALSNILADPHVARFDTALPMILTRIATAATMLFEFGAPLYLVAYGRGWERTRWAWISLGLAFHLGIAIGMRLGMFPWGMLALYPVLLRPEELTRIRSRTRRPETPA